ncbi:CAP domain-containing protein [Halobacillus sp. A5]|uniref:CAP domain-containing protein n=1 Tax=Halobacillus sp. A5 TaxID=2880263 RepID=UPI0020A69C31|nr:CAP domain-containing protein [Halobacillus sp. A5]MCP3028392.1 CAP domain-containing protein [Halobacillus sp. A5]
MKVKSLIVSGALALSLLAAPATSLASTGDSTVKVNQQNSNIEGALQWLTENEDALKGNTLQQADIQSLLEQLQVEQPAEAQEEEETPQEQPQEAPEQPAEEEPAQEEPAEAPQEPSTEEQAPAEQTAQEETTEEEPAEQEESDSEVSAFEQEVVDLTNEERAQQGLEPLELDVELSGVAKDKSVDMQQNNYFSHDSPTHGSPFDMMNEYGIDYTTAGENIAKGQTSPEEVVQGWMNSEGHRENIMNESFTHIGVGHAEDGNYWTQMFIAK